jgi:lysylphosphatidylglycerol synthetase-like protein (DUF2156 family)
VRIANQKDFAAGAMYLAFGIATAIGATRYNMGTPARMGPGYFPFWTGVVLAIVGLVVLLGSMTDREVDRLERWHFRPLLLVLASVVAFAGALRWGGLILAIIALVLVSSLASREFNWGRTVAIVAVLVPLTVLIFVYGLNLSFSLLPPFMGG